MLTLVSPLLHTPPPPSIEAPHHPLLPTEVRGWPVPVHHAPSPCTACWDTHPFNPGPVASDPSQGGLGPLIIPSWIRSTPPPPMLQWRCVSGALCLGRGLSQRLKPSGCSVNLEAKGGCCCRLAHSATFNYCTLWFGPSVHRPLLSCPKESLRLN